MDNLLRIDEEMLVGVMVRVFLGNNDEVYGVFGSKGEICGIEVVEGGWEGVV